MLEIGITGNIGSGKSAVTSYLRKKGYVVIDADEIVKLIYMDKDFQAEMIKKFGETIKSGDEDTQLDKKKIADLVFNNKDKLETLDKTVGPFFKKILDLELERHKNEKILFLDIPLLFEKNYQRFMDKIILVHCEEEIRYERASKRDQKTKEEIKKIDQSQMPHQEKLKLADYIIDNSGDLDNLHKQIEKTLESISALNE